MFDKVDANGATLTVSSSLAGHPCYLFVNLLCFHRRGEMFADHYLLAAASE